MQLSDRLGRVYGGDVSLLGIELPLPYHARDTGDGITCNDAHEFISKSQIVLPL